MAPSATPVTVTVGGVESYFQNTFAGALVFPAMSSQEPAAEVPAVLLDTEIVIPLNGEPHEQLFKPKPDPGVGSVPSIVIVNGDLYQPFEPFGDGWWAFAV